MSARAAESRELLAYDAGGSDRSAPAQVWFREIPEAEGGCGLVEAYPEQVEGREPQRGAYFHTCTENLVEEFGFKRDRRIAKWRWVMQRRV